jgi:hypothetical protein
MGTRECKRALENGCFWEPSTCSLAARMSDLQLLKMLERLAVPGTLKHVPSVPYMVICSGLTQMAARERCCLFPPAKKAVISQWARENGCPWDEDTCRSAAAGGHLELLKWVLSVESIWCFCGCDTSRTCRCSSVVRNIEVISFVLSFMYECVPFPLRNKTGSRPDTRAPLRLSCSMEISQLSNG